MKIRLNRCKRSFENPLFYACEAPKQQHVWRIAVRLCVRACSAYLWVLCFYLHLRAACVSYLWERKRAAGAVRWPAPAGSAKHWGWTGSSLRCSSQVLVSLVGAGGRRGGTPSHRQHTHTYTTGAQQIWTVYSHKSTLTFPKSGICLCTAQEGKNGNLL